MEILEQKKKVSLSEKCSEMTWILLPPREEKDSLETVASVRLRALSTKMNQCFYVNAPMQNPSALWRSSPVASFVKYFFISTHRLSLSVPFTLKATSPRFRSRHGGLLLTSPAANHHRGDVTALSDRPLLLVSPSGLQSETSTGHLNYWQPSRLGAVCCPGLRNTHRLMRPVWPRDRPVLI